MAYYDSSMDSGTTFDLLTMNINSTSSPLSLTVTPLQNTNLVLIVWNDEYIGQSGDGSSFAHSKTIVAYDPSTDTGYLYIFLTLNIM